MRQYLQHEQPRADKHDGKDDHDLEKTQTALGDRAALAGPRGL